MSKRNYRSKHCKSEPKWRGWVANFNENVCLVRNNETWHAEKCCYMTLDSYGRIEVTPIFGSYRTVGSTTGGSSRLSM